MKTFIIITPEGDTMAPDGQEVSNLQVLDFVTAEDKQTAVSEFKRTFSTKHGFNPDMVDVYEVVSQTPKIECDVAVMESLVDQIYSNFPEASISLECTKWDYDKFEFCFIDGDKTYTINRVQAITGLRTFFALVDDKKLPGLHIPADYKINLDGWDAAAFDACLQCAIFGAVVYG